MPYIVVTSLYPSDKVTEVGKKYLEAISKYPPNENLATQPVPAAVKGTHQGIQVLGISEVKKGKLEEAYTYVVSMKAEVDGTSGPADVASAGPLWPQGLFAVSQACGGRSGDVGGVRRGRTPDGLAL